MKLNEWIPLSEVSTIPEEVQFINCDTRDFHVFLSTEPNSNTESILTNIDEDSKYCIRNYSVFALLRYLQDITGGEGEWRHIQLKDHRWLKYIWFTRYDDFHFVVSTREGELLEPDKIEEMIDFSNPYLMTE
jgi:hypothetical protein